MERGPDDPRASGASEAHEGSGGQGTSRVPGVREDGSVKRAVPLFITFIVGWVLIIAFFIPHWPINVLRDNFNTTFDILAAIAFILGGGNLVRIHGDRVYRRGAGWGYSAVCLAGFVATLIVGLAKLRVSDGLLPRIDLTAAVLASGMYFDYAYNYLFKPLGASMFALLAFYVATASYRAFRARNVDASLLLATALVILVGRTFVGQQLTGWLPESLQFLHIPILANWIMAVPNQAGNRAIMIGVALGIVSLSLRVILAIDRSYLGREGE